MSSNSSPKKPFDNSYIRYSGLAFQMLGAILLGVFIGQWLDKKYATSKPVFTILFSLFFLIASMVVVLRGLMKK